jgi:hypothetical protein
MQSESLGVGDFLNIRATFRDFDSERRSFVKNSVGTKTFRYTQCNTYVNITLAPKYKTASSPYGDLPILRITKYLTYITSLLTKGLIDVLHAINTECIGGSKWDVNRVMSNRDTICVGDPLSLEGKFESCLDFVGLKTLCEDATILWEMWEKDEFPRIRLSVDWWASSATSTGSSQ